MVKKEGIPHKFIPVDSSYLCTPKKGDKVTG